MERSLRRVTKPSNFSDRQTVQLTSTLAVGDLLTASTNIAFRRQTPRRSALTPMRTAGCTTL